MFLVPPADLQGGRVGVHPGVQTELADLPGVCIISAVIQLQKTEAVHGAM